MKLASIFDIIVDAQDVLDLFDNVGDVDQLRGRLRRIGQIEADDLLTCLEGLRASIARAMHDTLELSPDLGEPDVLDDETGDSSKEGTVETYDDLTSGLGEGEEDQSQVAPTGDENKNPSP